MSGYAAFLRGINLGSRRRVSSAQLRSLFGEMGFERVETFRTSGNVVFDAASEPAVRITKRIQEGLAESLGYEVDVFLRTAKEIRAIADHQPFPTPEVEASKGKLQVVMLTAKPAPGTRNEMLDLATEDDALVLRGRELYWLPSAGIRDSALNRAIPRVLGSTTIRTKGTLDLLASKYFAG